MYSQSERRYGRPNHSTIARKPKWQIFYVMVIKRSDKGILVHRCARRDSLQAWLPASQVRLEHPEKTGQQRVAVPTWLFEKTPALHVAL